jgi:shikimate dehydrogenase
VELARRVSHDFSKDARAMELNFDNLTAALEKADILINATSVGMSPNSDETPVPARLLKSELVVFDVVYNPIRTRLLKEAEAAGARVIGGTDMLAWQGALAFEKWTGQPAPLDLMREEVIKALEGHED